MADPLSAISLGIQVAQGFVHYLKSFRSHSSEIESFVSSLERLKAILQLIREYIESPASRSDTKAKAIRTQLEKNVNVSSAAIAKLDRELRNLQPDVENSGMRVSLKNFGKQALWHFRKDTLPGLQATLAEILGTLGIGLEYYQLVQIDSIRNIMNEMRTQQEIQHIKSWLAAPDHSLKHKVARQRHLAGTASWIFDEPNFKHWVINPGVLWLNGIPGSGKTVLTSAIIERLRNDASGKACHVLAYFYFQYDDVVNSSAEMLTRSLIYQLSFTSNDCASQTENLYKTYQNKSEAPTLEELIIVLIDLVRSFTCTFVVLDALDEAPDSLWLWKVLKALSTTDIHLLLVSRPNVEIRPEIQTIKPIGIQIDSSKVDGDIRMVVKERLSGDEKLRLFSDSHKQIESSLVEKAGGMFQLVDSQLARLRDCRTTTKMNAALKAIPRSLDEIWTRCFTRIDEENLEESVRLLIWLCFSQRPVRVCELIDALAIPEDWIDGFELADARLKDPQALLDMGSGLVESDQTLATESKMAKEAIIRLAHASVKEWLQSENAAKMIPKVSLFSDLEGHSVLAQLCIQYLVQFNKECDWSEEDSKRWPLAEYSAVYWRIHMGKSNFGPRLIHLSCKLLFDLTALKKWQQILMSKERSRIKSMNNDISPRSLGVPLAYAAEYSLDPLVSHLLCKHNVHPDDFGSWRTALEVAIENKRLSTVTILVENGANVNIPPQNSNSILSLACEVGTIDMVRYLLDKGAVDEIGETSLFPSALATAATCKDEAITRLILDCGYKVNCRSSVQECTPLHKAASSLQLLNIRLLLERGAKKEMIDRDGNIPLHLAIKQEACTLEIEQLLNYEGAELTANEQGDIPFVASISGNREVCESLLKRTPYLRFSKLQMTVALIKAAARGFLYVVDTLYQSGADFTDGEKHALIEASSHGHLDTMQFLLDHGHYIDVVDTEGLTPFLHAIDKGQRKVWKLLAEQGAWINAVDNLQRNACHLTVLRNDIEGLEWLLARGTELDHGDKNGWTPLHLAAQLGPIELVKFLVGRKASLDTRDIDGNTIAHFSAANGHLDILQWLSELGMTMISEDNYGQTPFYDAVHYGSLECAEFLSKHFLESESWRLAKGVTALGLAARQGHVNLVRWMCEMKLNVNEPFDWSPDQTQNPYYALRMAVEHSKYDVAELLLENGADPDLSSLHGTTPILEAAEYQSVSFLSLLMKYGAQTQNIQDKDGDDVLSLAVLNLNEDVLLWVLEHCAGHRFNATDIYGFYPMLTAAMFDRVKHIQALHHAGFQYSVPKQSSSSDTNLKSVRASSLWYAYRSLKNAYQRIDVHDRYTPLMVAAFKGHLAVVGYLFTVFPDMRMCLDKDGNDALNYACCAGHTNVTRFLIEHEFDTSRTNRAGRNARMETLECLQCLNADNLIEEDDRRKREREALVSRIDHVLSFLNNYRTFQIGDRNEMSKENPVRENATTGSNVEEEVAVFLKQQDSHQAGNEANNIEHQGTAEDGGQK